MSKDSSPLSALCVYIPIDRRHALAQGKLLPERTGGAALFADISGFTPLTEALTKALGPRRGIEELTRQLNLVYDALIAQVDSYGGSVLGFSGDAITCWFDEQLPDAPAPPAAPLRAVACALGMQQAMRQFAAVMLPEPERVTLTVKVAVASGPARRFLVGNENIQLMDVLAGQTLIRMATGESLAKRGEVLIDSPTLELLSAGQLGETQLGGLGVTEWRVAPDTQERFAVVDKLLATIEPTPWPALPPAALSEAQMRPWLVPAVYERLTEGLGEFLTELRPCVALFLRFAGIDYDNDQDATTKLDAYIHWVQSVVAHYEGTFIQLTIGEKRSYLYIAFGAPVAHEDDARRAVGAALELGSPPAELDYINQVQIGISQGTMRTGSYGGLMRRTYGALGDEVNLAARLMQHAIPDGDILVSQRVQKATANDFIWETLEPIHVKGKTEPVPVASLVGKRQAAEGALFTGALVGRETELQQLVQFAQPIFKGSFAGLIYVYGEAGVGKSRLVYELQKQLSNLNSDLKWLTCPAEQILRQSLNPFKHLLRKYFDQYADSPEEGNKARFNRKLNELLAWVQSLGEQELYDELDWMRSMLGALVGLHWEKSLYEHLEPKLRFENTLTAFKTLVKVESLRQPVIVHIEDAHWLDSDSHELVKVLTRNIEGYPVAVLLTGRYQDDGSRFDIGLDADIPQQAIDLNTLSPAGIRVMAAQVLGNTIAVELARFLTEKTNGNPLFVEQLALDLRERGAVRLEDNRWTLEHEEVQVPASINAVLIARLDRLAARVKAAVQTAAVLGIEFEVRTLSYMLRGDPEAPVRVKQAEAEMIWVALNELRYVFRYTLLRDAAYDMQLQARLKELHALAGAAIEQAHASDLKPYYADLAHHYGKALNAEQEFLYARLAGEQAAAQFANNQAIAHLQQALQSAQRLDPAQTAQERQAIHVTLGELLTITGQYNQAKPHLDTALSLAAAHGDLDTQARACRWLARSHELRGEYPTALEWVQKGLFVLEGRETAQAAELLLMAGLIHTRQGNYDAALEECQQGLRIAEKLSQQSTLAGAYNLLGHITRLRGHGAIAIEHFERCLDLYQRAGDLNGQAAAHNQIANACFNIGRWQEAEQHYCQAREIYDQLGDTYHRATTDNNLGGIMLNQGRLDEALMFYQSGLRALETIGGSPWVFGIFNMNLGAAFVRRRQIDAARQRLRASQDYFNQAKSRDFLPEMQRHLAEAALCAGDLPEAQEHGQQALALARELSMRGEEGSALRVLGETAAAQDQPQQAAIHLEESIAILQQVGQEYESARSQLALAQVKAKQNQDQAGMALLDQCIPIFERLGAAPELQLARALKKQFSLPSP